MRYARRVARRLVLALGFGLGVVSGCSLLTDLSGFSNGGDGGPLADGAQPDVDGGGGSDAATDAPGSDDAASDADAGSDAAMDGSTCSCTSLVSAYRFADANDLGHDFFGKNSMPTVKGTPKQATAVPPGFSGHSIELDGASTVCIDTGYTFVSTADHTLCWWSRPSALADSTNQFAQTCSYDTWTSNTGANYLWRINNCNSGTAANLEVPNVYAVGKWTQVCQTYQHATMTRTVIIGGVKTSVVDTVPIVENTSSWCIGSYGSGGYWTGLIYQPMWFDRVLSDAEIAQVSASACCLP